MNMFTKATLFVMAAAVAEPAIAAEVMARTAQDLAKDLANPVAALISVPLQLNHDQHIGMASKGERWTLNVQPVVPFSLNEDWNIISRTILPLTQQQDVIPALGTQRGVGDMVQSVFFSPKKPTSNGWILGAGPVLLLPTGSDDLLTLDQWGAGPTAVALRQQGVWTYGVLANHLWSFAGSNTRNDVNASFLQPFLSYTTPNAWSYSLQTESTYDWESKHWSVPVHIGVSKVTKVAGQLLNISGGAGYWVESPDNGPEGLRLRLSVTLLFPK
jgi:hypothetical protein